MAKRKEEEAATESVPIWFITYADMVTLLLAMFVILTSMSKVQEDKFHQVMDSVQQYLGYEKGDAAEPGDAVSGSLYESIRRVAIEVGSPIAEGAPVNSTLGQYLRVETIDEGYKMTVGGKVLFDEGSAQLKPSAFEPLDRLAEIVRGYRNKLEIRGHTGIEALPQKSPYADLFDLAYFRAKAVKDYLASVGIDSKRMRILSGGQFDRPDSNLTYEGKAANRRVEVIASDELVPPDGAGGK